MGEVGRHGATGIETVGMGMITMLIVLVMLVLMLVVPSVAGGIGVGCSSASPERPCSWVD